VEGSFLASQGPIVFTPNQWVVDRHNPGLPGQWTGESRRAGPMTMLELVFPDGSTAWRPLDVLEALGKSRGTLVDRLLSGKFGLAQDLRRVMTYEKLKGTLHDVIYSMEAAQIDFYPYQFKPVIKLINAPTERLVLADEVGLGKTIESALIWLELQARREAKRMLVVCPRTLAEKWKEELRQKFFLDARIVGFQGLLEEIKYLRDTGPSHQFILISTYTALRPPRDEISLLQQPPEEGEAGGAKTQFLRELRHRSYEFEPFDLVVFDEAHYMRNPATTTFHLGESLTASAGAVLCVSATPINNSNTDLHTLLRLVDEDFFESQGLFEELLKANAPAVQARNALETSPPNRPMLEKAIMGMEKSRFIRDAPLFKKFVQSVKELDSADRAAIAKCQSLVESLNLLGSYVNRTRRLQVKEHRPVRDPHVLEVEYTPEEMRFYSMILQIVRDQCRRDSRPFHVFQVLGLQLRAASCLPALAREIRENSLGDSADILEEAFGEEDSAELFTEPSKDGSMPLLDDILLYDFESNDSKYNQLRRMLTDQLSDEKVVIFAFYRDTLSYLEARLAGDGVASVVIHGNIPDQERWSRIARFRDPNGPRVLLSSEVGSEGIDLQFCRIVINYDLPWNPMRVEQRIGRIDRVGQQASRLAIVNFKVRGTVEERLYERLHEKLARFTNSLGDLDSVIGQVVRQLTVDLLSKNLSPAQEIERMEQAALVIENKLLTIQNLEESGDALVGLSDYLQKHIEDVRRRGRYLQAEELEDYVCDFFDRQFEGTEVKHNTPVGGCLSIRLSSDAHASLNAFLRNDNSVSARFFRQQAFTITFRSEAMERLSVSQRRLVHRVNHMCPFVRWITARNKDMAHSLYDVSALQLNEGVLKSGEYCYLIERWKMRGLVPREHLAYAVSGLKTDYQCSPEQAEEVVQCLRQNGKDWNYPQYEPRSLEKCRDRLDAELTARFDLAVQDFDATNATALQIRQQRVRGFYERRIEQDKARLASLELRRPDSPLIKASEGRLRRAEENKQAKLQELEVKAEVDVERSPVAAGIFRII